MPGRSIGSRSASSGYRAKRALTNVPSVATGAGMNRHSDWLVDDDHMIIVIDNFEVEVLRHRRKFIQCVAGQVKFDSITRIDPYRRTVYNTAVN